MRNIKSIKIFEMQGSLTWTKQDVDKVEDAFLDIIENPRDYIHASPMKPGRGTILSNALRINPFDTQNYEPIRFSVISSPQQHYLDQDLESYKDVRFVEFEIDLGLWGRDTWFLNSSGRDVEFDVSPFDHFGFDKIKKTYNYLMNRFQYLESLGFTCDIYMQNDSKNFNMSPTIRIHLLARIFKDPNSGFRKFTPPDYPWRGPVHGL